MGTVSNGDGKTWIAVLIGERGALHARPLLLELLR